MKHLAWKITFACRAQRDLATHVVLRIVKGSCAGESATAVFEASIAAGEGVPLPDDLARGVYGFSGEAYEGDRLVAQGCEQAELPRSSPVTLELRPERGVCSELDAGLDASDAAAGMDEHHAGSDAAATCEGSACSADAGCQGEACFPWHTYLAFTGASSDRSFRLFASSPRVDEAAVVRVSTRDGGEPLFDAASALTVFGGGAFSCDMEPCEIGVDAFALLADGRLLLSTRDSAVLASEPIEDYELVAYDSLAQKASRYFDATTFFMAESGVDLDVDAAHVGADGTLYFSLEQTAKTYSGVTCSAADLLSYDGSEVRRVVDGTLSFGGRDLESIAVQPESGHFLIALAGEGALSQGESVTGDDVLELAFGPGDAPQSGYSVWLRGADEFAEPDGELSVLHVEPRAP